MPTALVTGAGRGIGRAITRATRPAPAGRSSPASATIVSRERPPKRVGASRRSSSTSLTRRTSTRSPTCCPTARRRGQQRRHRRAGPGRGASPRQTCGVQFGSDLVGHGIASGASRCSRGSSAGRAGVAIVLIWYDRAARSSSAHGRAPTAPAKLRRWRESPTPSAWNAALGWSQVTSSKPGPTTPKPGARSRRSRPSAWRSAITSPRHRGRSTRRMSVCPRPAVRYISRCGSATPHRRTPFARSSVGIAMTARRPRPRTLAAVPLHAIRSR